MRCDAPLHKKSRVGSEEEEVEAGRDIESFELNYVWVSVNKPFSESCVHPSCCCSFSGKSFRVSRTINYECVWTVVTVLRERSRKVNCMRRYWTEGRKWRQTDTASDQPFVSCLFFTVCFHSVSDVNGIYEHHAPKWAGSVHSMLLWQPGCVGYHYFTHQWGASSDKVLVSW